MHERSGVEDSVYAFVLTCLGSLDEVLGDFDAAEACYLRALEILSTELPKDHPDVALTWVRLGNLGYRRADYPQARERYREAVRRYKASGHTRDASLATVLAKVPDGALATVPLQALPDGEGFLLQRYTIGQLDHASLLARPRREGTGRGAVLVGGVAYGDVASRERGGTQCVERSFGALPGTLEEVRSIAETLERYDRKAPVTVLMGLEADEQAVVGASVGARVLHLATHGFFADASCLPEVDPDDLHNRWVVDDNPMVRSGLVLAEGNLGVSGDSDGLWTAEEVAGLSLEGVELVVLSACDTGLGEVVAGEGVLGLSRGLSQAGAGAVVMSLWTVPDDETRDLMTDLYREVLARHRSPVEALRRAQLRALRRAERRWGEPRPELWASFVVSGLEPSRD